MSERLTEEQVEAALKLARGAAEFDRLHRYDRDSIPEMSILSLSLALLQLHADLEAARRSVQGLCVQLDETQEERNLAEGQRDRAASALSSLREAARGAVAEEWRPSERSGVPVCPSCNGIRPAHRRGCKLSALRSLLEVKA